MPPESHESGPRADRVPGLVGRLMPRDSLARRLVPDSSLFLGGSETIIGLCPALKINTGCPGLYALQDTIAQAPHPSLIKGAGAGARLAT